MVDERALRITSNESRFREINERLKADLTPLADHDAELLPFVCECGHSECRDMVELSLAEYEQVRHGSDRFAVALGHEIGDVEDVVGRTERYLVVRKHPETRPYARVADPRT